MSYLGGVLDVKSAHTFESLIGLVLHNDAQPGWNAHWIAQHREGNPGSRLNARLKFERNQLILAGLIRVDDLNRDLFVSSAEYFLKRKEQFFLE